MDRAFVEYALAKTFQGFYEAVSDKGKGKGRGKGAGASAGAAAATAGQENAAAFWWELAKVGFEQLSLSEEGADEVEMQRWRLALIAWTVTSPPQPNLLRGIIDDFRQSLDPAYLEDKKGPGYHQLLELHIQEVLAFYHYGNPPDGKFPISRFPGINSFFANEEDLGRIKRKDLIAVFDKLRIKGAADPEVKQFLKEHDPKVFQRSLLEFLRPLERDLPQPVLQTYETNILQGTPIGAGSVGAASSRADEPQEPEFEEEGAGAGAKAAGAAAPGTNPFDRNLRFSKTDVKNAFLSGHDEEAWDSVVKSPEEGAAKGKGKGKAPAKKRDEREVDMEDQQEERAPEPAPKPAKQQKSAPKPVSTKAPQTSSASKASSKIKPLSYSDGEDNDERPAPEDGDEDELDLALAAAAAAASTASKSKGKQAAASASSSKQSAASASTKQSSKSAAKKPQPAEAEEEDELSPEPKKPRRNRPADTSSDEEGLDLSAIKDLAKKSSNLKSLGRDPLDDILENQALKIPVKASKLNRPSVEAKTVEWSGDEDSEEPIERPSKGKAAKAVKGKGKAAAAAEEEEEEEEEEDAPSTVALKAPAVKIAETPKAAAASTPGSPKDKHPRARRPFSKQEIAALKEGVENCGKGNWAVILAKYKGTFDGRTSVDLKDKWRNMEKNGHV